MSDLFRPILHMTLPSIAIKTHPTPPLGSFSLKIFFASKHWPSNSTDRLTCHTNWTARKVTISNLPKGNPVPGVGAPVPGVGTPVPGVGAPVPGVGTPVPGVGTRVPGAGAPVPGVGAPVPGGEMARIQILIRDDINPKFG